MRTQKQSGRRHSQRGIAMAISLFALTAFILVVATSMLVGSADIRATRDYRRTAQVHFVAESGILHAIQVANQAVGIGVENFQNDVVDNWNTSWTPSTKTFTALPGFTYSVLALPNDANSGYFRATAFGPESATNTVVASVSRSVIPSTAPGALHLADAGNTNATFNGNGFSISGNDMNYDGTGAGPGAPVPGLSTLNDTNTQEALGSSFPVLFVLSHLDQLAGERDFCRRHLKSGRNCLPHGDLGLIDIASSRSESGDFAPQFLVLGQRLLEFDALVSQEVLNIRFFKVCFITDRAKFGELTQELFRGRCDSKIEPFCQFLISLRLLLSSSLFGLLRCDLFFDMGNTIASVFTDSSA